MAIKSIEYLWEDKKRHWGMPISFTKYKLSADRFFIETGFLSKKYEEILLYRVRDISLKRSLGQRLVGVGTIMLYASDTSSPSIEIKNVKKSEQVKELIHLNVEEAKTKARVRVGEVVGGGPAFRDEDGDGLPD